MSSNDIATSIPDNSLVEGSMWPSEKWKPEIQNKVFEFDLATNGRNYVMINRSNSTELVIVCSSVGKNNLNSPGNCNIMTFP